MDNTSWIIKIEITAKEDLKYFRKNDKNLYIKSFDIIQDILDNPEFWIWKPERLKYYWDNLWSRRLDEQHRVVYNVNENKKTIDFLSFRYHYDKNKGVLIWWE